MCVFSLNGKLQLHLARDGRSMHFHSLLVVLIAIELGVGVKGTVFICYLLYTIELCIECN